MLEEDWMVPLLPLKPGRCINCCDEITDGVCRNCGLNPEEDQQVHEELREMIAPGAPMLKAAREANRQGRRLLGLKLATAASAMRDPQVDMARGMRVWLLSAIGEPEAALEDAKAWVEYTRSPSALAWGSLGQQYQHGGFPGSAADAFQKALERDPKQHAMRARRAQLLMQLHREGQAAEEAILVFDSSEGDEQAIALALEVAEKLSDRYESQFRDDEIQRLLTHAGPYVSRSAKMLAHRARIAAMNGEVKAAKRDLKAARRLEPDLEAYARIEKVLKPQRTSWWRW